MANQPKALVWAIVGNIVLCGAAYCVAEDADPFSALWWAVVTGSTTGYGDMFPKTTPGRLIGIFFIVSMWVLDRLASAQFVARLFDDPDRFSHSEQESVIEDADTAADMATEAVAVSRRVEELLTQMMSRLDDLDAREKDTADPSHRAD